MKCCKNVGNVPVCLSENRELIFFRLLLDTVYALKINYYFTVLVPSEALRSLLRKINIIL